MRAIRLVARYEISTILTKRSFWLTTLLFPAVVLVLNLGSMRLATLSEARQRDRLENVSSQVVGYVDLSGRITTLPSDIAPETILPFASEDEARGALAAGRISRYYVVPADWVETGSLRLVDRQLTFSLGEARGPFAYVLYTNLLGDEVRARRLLTPDEITRYPLDSNATESDNGPLGMTYVAMFIFFFLLTMSSSLLLQSVSREKENRTAKVLLLSLRPHELMAGKILGLGLVALLQGAVWVSAAALLGSRPSFLGLSSSLRLSASTLPWLIAYLALGYLQYAALMAALGAMAPSAREWPVHLCRALAAHGAPVAQPVCDPATERAPGVGAESLPPQLAGDYGHAFGDHPGAAVAIGGRVGRLGPHQLAVGAPGGPAVRQRSIALADRTDLAAADWQTAHSQGKPASLSGTSRWPPNPGRTRTPR
jgi:ABC-2 type transport system permease protein